MKNFGRSGRTKYTHLLDQDTMVSSRSDGAVGAVGGGGAMGPRVSTAADAQTFGWGVDDEVTRKYMQKMGGAGSLDTLGKKRKRT